MKLSHKVWCHSGRLKVYRMFFLINQVKSLAADQIINNFQAHMGKYRKWVLTLKRRAACKFWFCGADWKLSKQRQLSHIKFLLCFQNQLVHALFLCVWMWLSIPGHPMKRENFWKIPKTWLYCQFWNFIFTYLCQRPNDSLLPSVGIGIAK